MTQPYLLHLETIIRQRVQSKDVDSYTSALYNKGNERICQKFGEEAIELVIAAATNNRQETVKETADLLFHLLLMLNKAGITLNDIDQELIARSGISGITEKKQRTSQS